MKNGNLLLGLGLGTLVGVAVGYYMTAEHRRKLEAELSEVGHEIKDGVKTVFSKVKAKAENAEEKVEGKAEEFSDKAKAKAAEWSEKASDKASGMADNFSQKANDSRRYSDSHTGTTGTSSTGSYTGSTTK